ncbi:MAG: TlpA family protein disulfide reductase [Acidobacteriota bacterium]|nr:TlpA family protein disulfide reductase [Acidobacteriota bacterium]
MRLLLCSILLLSFTAPAQQSRAPRPSTQSAPRTPTEAYERAAEALRAPGPTLETYVQALKEQEQRAREFARAFKVADWRGEQLFNLGQLYSLAERHADTEAALTEYLRDPAAIQAKAARQLLLYTLIAEQRWDAAVDVADRLLAAPQFDEEVVYSTQALIDGLRVEQIERAIAVAEKRHPKLLQRALEKGRDPSQAAGLLIYALELGQLCREAGRMPQADDIVRSLRTALSEGPLAANETARRSVESTIRRVELLRSAAPPLEVSEQLGAAPASTLAALKGKVVLLDFFAHHCVPCVASIPELNRLKKEYESQGLAVLGVTAYFGYFGAREKITPDEERASLQNLLAERRAAIGFLVGPTSNFVAYGVSGLPAVALIDRAGQVRYLKIGDAIGAKTERLVRALLAEPASPAAKAEAATSAASRQEEQR